MKFRINKNDFLQGLEIVSHSIPQKTPYQYLKGVKIDILQEEILLLGSDSEIIISYELKSESYECLECGNILVPFTMLYSIIQKMKNESIEFELVQNQLNIKCGRSHFKLATLDYNQYPNFDLEREGDNKLYIKASTIKEIIKEVAFSCSKSEKNPILTGVNFRCLDNKLKCVATDSFRLSQKEIGSIIPITNEDNADEEYIPFGDEEKEDCNFDVTISSKTLNYLNKVIGNYDGDLELYLSKTKAIFKFNDIIFSTRLLDGSYPDTSKLIRSDYNLVLQFNREELLDTLNRVSILSAKDSFKDSQLTYNVVKMKVDLETKEVEFICDNKSVGEAKEFIKPISIDNQVVENEFVIAYSSKYLIEALNSFTCESIYIYFNGNVRPFIIRDEHFTENNNIQLLLPIKMN